MARQSEEGPTFKTPWRFSLRALLALMTLVAVIVALLANRPKIAAVIGSLLAVAAVLHIADRLVASMGKPTGRKWYARLLAAAWLAAGSTLLVIGGFLLVASGAAFGLNGIAGSPWTTVPIWSASALMLCGSIYCFFQAGKEIRRTRD